MMNTMLKESNQVLSDSKETVQEGICLGPTEQSWRMLATAIVIRAIKDYEKAVARQNIKGQDGVEALEDFFASEWCEALVSMGTGIDCQYNDGELTRIIQKSREAKNAKKRKKIG